MHADAFDQGAPLSATGDVTQVTVELEVDDGERAALNSASGPVDIPEHFSVVTTYDPMIGYRFSSGPLITIQHEFAGQGNFLQTCAACSCWDKVAVTPRGEQPIERLRAAIMQLSIPDEVAIERSVQQGEELWAAAHPKHTLVRGKYVLNTFASRCSTMTSGQALLEAVARARPELPAIKPLKATLAFLLVTTR